jgi:hypothetical protein
MVILLQAEPLMESVLTAVQLTRQPSAAGVPAVRGNASTSHGRKADVRNARMDILAVNDLA